MKEIPNLVFDKTSPDGKNASVARLLLECLKTPPAGGFDFATMRARSRVDDVLQKVEDGGVIKLEDADFAVALEAAKATRWNVYSTHLVKFAEMLGI